MTVGRKELGNLTSQLAEALDDLALAVEDYRIKGSSDPKVIQSYEITQAAIYKAQKESLH